MPDMGDVNVIVIGFTIRAKDRQQRLRAQREGRRGRGARERDVARAGGRAEARPGDRDDLGDLGLDHVRRQRRDGQGVERDDVASRDRRQAARQGHLDSRAGVGADARARRGARDGRRVDQHHAGGGDSGGGPAEERTADVDEAHCGRASGEAGAGDGDRGRNLGRDGGRRRGHHRRRLDQQRRGAGDAGARREVKRHVGIQIRLDAQDRRAEGDRGRVLDGAHDRPGRVHAQRERRARRGERHGAEARRGAEARARDRDEVRDLGLDHRGVERGDRRWVERDQVARGRRVQATGQAHLDRRGLGKADAGARRGARDSRRVHQDAGHVQERRGAAEERAAGRGGEAHVRRATSETSTGNGDRRRDLRRDVGQR